MLSHSICSGFLTSLRTLGLLAVACLAPAGAGTLQPPEAEIRNPIGTGDGRIHVIPALAPYSVKNGETLTISAVVRSEQPVASVTADFAGIEKVALQPGALNTWTADWTAEGLEEKVYTATLTVTDVTGHSWSDHTLRFSDPAAGNSTPGTTTTYPAGGMTRLGGVPVAGFGAFTTALIDENGEYGYFGTYTIPGRIVKVALGTGTNLPTYVGELTLSTGEEGLYSGVIDSSDGHAYFLTDTIPGRVVKVALGDGNDAPTRVGAATLLTGEDQPRSIVIDAANGHLYVGTTTSPGRVIKLSVGDQGAPPVRLGGIVLAAGENSLATAVIDELNGYAYFGTQTIPGRIVKIALGDGDADPSRLGALTLGTGENEVLGGVIDAGAGYAYFGTLVTPGRIVKVALGDGDAAPTRIGAATLLTGEGQLTRGVIDLDRQTAYFGCDTNPGRVVAVALGEGDNAPSRIGALQLGASETNVWCGVIDPPAGRAYFGTATSPGQIVALDLTQRNFLKATRLDLPEDGEITDVRFYSHSAEGNIRLAIYDNAEPKNLLWESGDVINSVEDDFLIVPIGLGSPSSLTLPPGTYWIGWQTDALGNVASHTVGDPAEGFKSLHAFGAAPSSLASGAILSTNDRWSTYLTYVLPDTSGEVILFSSEFDSILRAIDLGSGVVIRELPIGATDTEKAIRGFTSITTNPLTGALIGLASQHGGDSLLVNIEPILGTATELGSGFPRYDEIAFDHRGDLYGIQLGDDFTSSTIDLVKFDDPQSPQFLRMFEIPRVGFDETMAFNPNDRNLYRYSTPNFGGSKGVETKGVGAKGISEPAVLTKVNPAEGPFENLNVFGDMTMTTTAMSWHGRFEHFLLADRNGEVYTVTPDGEIVWQGSIPLSDPSGIAVYIPQPACPTLESVLVGDDIVGDDDQSPEPGETISLRLGIENRNFFSMHNVRGTLSTTGSATIISGTSDYPILSPSAFGENDELFVLEIDTTAECGGILELSLEIVSDEITCTIPIFLEIGFNSDGELLFGDGFEGGLGGWFADSLWHIKTNTACLTDRTLAPAAEGSSAASFSLVNGCTYDTESTVVGDLTMFNSVAIPANSLGAELSWMNLAETETNSEDSPWDRQEVYVSDNGGDSWTQLYATSATSVAWTKRSVSLDDYIGRDIRVRFTFNSGDGNSNDYLGWYVDDVQIRATRAPNCDFILDCPQVSFSSVDDSDGNDDGNADPGETFDIYVAVNNPQPNDFLDTAFEVVTDDPWVSITGGTYFSEQMMQNSPETFFFTATIDPARPCGDIEFIVRMTGTTSNCERTFIVPVQTSTAFFDDFEVPNSALWAGSGLWHYAPAGECSVAPDAETGSFTAGFNHQCTYDYGRVTGALELLRDATIDSGAGVATLSWLNWAETENSGSGASWDIQIVEVTTDGQNWTEVYQESATSTEWTTVEVDLSGYVGQTIRVRFVFDSVDGSSNDTRGWYIDNVAIRYAPTETCVFDPEVTPTPTPYQEPTPTPAWTPAPSPTLTVTPTPFPTGTPTASPTPTVVPSPTPSTTGTVTPTPQPSFTITPSPSPSPTPVLEPCPEGTPFTVTATPTASPTPTPSPTPEILEAAVLGITADETNLTSHHTAFVVPGKRSFVGFWIRRVNDPSSPSVYLGYHEYLEGSTSTSIPWPAGHPIADSRYTLSTRLYVQSVGWQGGYATGVYTDLGADVLPVVESITYDDVTKEAVITFTQPGTVGASVAFWYRMLDIPAASPPNQVSAFGPAPGAPWVYTGVRGVPLLVTEMRIPFDRGTDNYEIATAIYVAGEGFKTPYTINFAPTDAVVYPRLTGIVARKDLGKITFQFSPIGNTRAQVGFWYREVDPITCEPLCDWRYTALTNYLPLKREVPRSWFVPNLGGNYEVAARVYVNDPLGFRGWISNFLIVRDGCFIASDFNKSLTVNQAEEIPPDHPDAPKDPYANGFYHQGTVGRR